MQKAQNIYKFHPQGGGGAGTRHGLRKLHQGNSPWLLLRVRDRAAQNPRPRCPAGQAVPTGAQQTGLGNAGMPVPAGNGYGLPVFADTGRMGNFINI